MVGASPNFIFIFLLFLERRRAKMLTLGRRYFMFCCWIFCFPRAARPIPKKKEKITGRDPDPRRRVHFALFQQHIATIQPTNPQN